MKLAAALALLATLVAGSCYREPAPPQRPSEPRAPYAAVLSDPLAFLPADAEVVGVIDVRQVRASTLWQRLEPRLLVDLRPALDEFQRTCGFDGLAAVRRVSFGLRLGDGRASGVFVMKGMGRDQILDCARRRLDAKLGALRIDGHVITVQKPGGPTMVGTFADASTLVILVGPDAAAPRLDATMRAGAPLRRSPGFEPLLATVAISDPLWFVVHGSSRLAERAAVFGMRPLAITGSVNLSSGLVANGRIQLATRDEANQLAGIVQPQLSAVSGFVEEIAVSAEQADVVLRLRMTQEQVDALVTMAGLTAP